MLGHFSRDQTTAPQQGNNVTKYRSWICETAFPFVIGWIPRADKSSLLIT